MSWITQFVAAALSPWTLSLPFQAVLGSSADATRGDEMRFSTVAVLGTLSSLATAIDPPRQPRQPLGNGTRILTYNETVGKTTFSASSLSVSWLSGEEDGLVIYLSPDSGDLVQENFVTGETSTFVPAEQIPEDYYDYWIRSDQEKVLFATNYTKQYRHSYFADYQILDVASGELTPLVDDQVGDIQYAEFAPLGDAIAYVRGNNLYIYNGTSSTQVTEDGGPDLFNAVPDWVYEEEIFGDRYALWWSPDAQYIAYLSFNETGVGTFTIPYFMDSQEIAPVYPRELELRYPKAGTTNPTVDFRLLELETMTVDNVEYAAFERNDTIIGEVAWVTDAHSSVVYRAFNRVQDQEKLILVDVESLEPKAVRERDGSDGWLDDNIAIAYVGSIDDSNQTYYLDKSDISGWNHLYLFPVEGGDNITLTSGEWEVVSVLKIDSERGLVYYTSTEHHSTERHVYSVSMSTQEKTPLVDDTVAAWWSASFSSAGGYYILNYGGPDVPYQELYSINDTATPIRVVRNNTALYNKIQQYNLPNITYFELEHPSGFTLNVMQRLPPNFDPSKKYAALFAPYGGPGAQEVTKSYKSITHLAYWASDPELQYITYVVDNRGTGYKGRAFRSTVASQLGKLEPEDQIWAAQQLLARHDYIDADHVTMWGWSFGGYLTSKVLEANSGVFSLGLITAPVSDWRLYDSMYTERYMKLPSTNEAGYNLTAVRNPAGFKNVTGRFAIMHGTGDDNVHYQNSAALVDLLVGAGVSPEKMDMMAFTDSDHSIRYHGATTYIYKYLTKMLWEERRREPSQVLTHQWSRKRSDGKVAARFEA